MTSDRVIVHQYNPYYFLCWEAADAMARAEKEHAKIRSKYGRSKKWSEEDDHRAQQLVDETHTRVVAAPVFGIMAIEQLLHVYAVERLRKFDQVLEHIDRLDLETKWRLVLPLACGRELPRKSVAIAKMQKLASLRNHFTHPKPIVVSDPTDEKIENLGRKLEAHARMRYDVAREAPTTVSLLACELAELDRHHCVRKLIKGQGIPLRSTSDA